MRVKIIEDNYIGIPINTVLEVTARPSGSFDVTSQELVAHKIPGMPDDGFVYYLDEYVVEIVEE